MVFDQRVKRADLVEFVTRLYTVSLGTAKIVSIVPTVFASSAPTSGREGVILATEFLILYDYPVQIPTGGDDAKRSSGGT